MVTPDDLDDFVMYVFTLIAGTLVIIGAGATTAFILYWFLQVWA